MPALGAGIHVFSASSEDVDGRDKPGHDASLWLDVNAPCPKTLRRSHPARSVGSITPICTANENYTFLCRSCTTLEG
jgi:hypothetical protein